MVPQLDEPGPPSIALIETALDLHHVSRIGLPLRIVAIDVGDHIVHIVHVHHTLHRLFVPAVDVRTYLRHRDHHQKFFTTQQSCLFSM